MADERISGINGIDVEQWMLNMYGTEIAWKESEVYEEYRKGKFDSEWDNLDSYEALEDWCRLMMIGILGKEVAMQKYPEMFI